MPLPLTFFRIPRTAAAPSAAPSVNGMCQNCTWDIFHVVRASCGRLFFLCPGVPLGRQPHGPPPLPKKPAALPTEETPRPFTFRRQACRYFASSGVRFCHFYPGVSGQRTPFCRLRIPQPGALPPGKGHKPGLAAAPTHFVHSLYTSRTKKHNKITRRKPRILDSSFGLLYQRLTPL